MLNILYKSVNFCCKETLHFKYKKYNIVSHLNRVHNVRLFFLININYIISQIIINIQSMFLN